MIYFGDAPPMRRDPHACPAEYILPLFFRVSDPGWRFGVDRPVGLRASLRSIRMRENHASSPAGETGGHREWTDFPRRRFIREHPLAPTAPSCRPVAADPGDDGYDAAGGAFALLPFSCRRRRSAPRRRAPL